MLNLQHKRSLLLIPSYRVVAIAAVAMCIAGCSSGNNGPPRAAVSGEVFLNGEPLTAGVIRFVPKEGTPGPVVFSRIRDGSYETGRRDGPVLGSHRVEIDADLEDDPANDAGDLEEARLEYIKRHGPIAVVRIPEQYNRKSTLEADIEPDQLNVHDFELTAARKP